MNPNLGPLAANGGPTQTHALLNGSPALDAGGTSANGCPATDQRGTARPQGAACDIGSYEFQPALLPAPQPSGAPVSAIPLPLPMTPKPTAPLAPNGPPAPLPMRRP